MSNETRNLGIAKRLAENQVKRIGKACSNKYHYCQCLYHQNRRFEATKKGRMKRECPEVPK